MSGSFFERIDELDARVGNGTLHGEVEVDQVYAKYQELRDDLNHPRGGQAHYLGGPFLASVEDNMRKIAKTFLEPGGPTDGMIDLVEATSRSVFEHSPVEWGDLRDSGHPKVTDDGHVVYDRPPVVPRLSEIELRAKGKLRTLGITP